MAVQLLSSSSNFAMKSCLSCASFLSGWTQNFTEWAAFASIKSLLLCIHFINFRSLERLFLPISMGWEWAGVRVVATPVQLQDPGHDGYCN